MKTLRIIIAALFMAIASSVMAQVTVSTSQLNGTRWKIKGNANGVFANYFISTICQLNGRKMTAQIPRIGKKTNI